MGSISVRGWVLDSEWIISVGCECALFVERGVGGGVGSVCERDGGV